MHTFLQLTPSGHLITTPTVSAEKKSEGTEKSTLTRAFKHSIGEGLFSLANQSLGNDDTSLIFWKKFAVLFVDKLCKIPSNDLRSPILAPLTKTERLDFLENAPPMNGAEYLDEDAFINCWAELNHWTTQSIQASKMPLSDWLKKNAPQYHQVGRVCFHLAENKNSIDYPFAFLATYAPRIAEDGNLKFLPLGQALKEFASTQNKTALTQLLIPVHEASKHLPFVSQLVESEDIYHPIAWTPQEAHQFLKSIPVLEQSGLLTRLPNWWKTRKRAQVSVSIGESTKSNFGANTLLSFKSQLTIGENPLSQEEIDELLAGESGLIRLNGEWIGVDTEKLTQALEHWQRVEEQAANGHISFIEGMRLLAGTNTNNPQSSNNPNQSDTIKEWSDIQASESLAQTLNTLQNPDQLLSTQQPTLLNATLRPYQKHGFNWLQQIAQLGLGAILADDMGLGKTIQIIALFLSIKETNLSKFHNVSSPHPSRLSSFDTQFPQKSDPTHSSSSFHNSAFKVHTSPSLLILPASLLGNWKSEFEKFAPSLNLAFIHSSETDKSTLDAYAKNPEDKLSTTDVVITTYGMILRNHWIQNMFWNLLILDEAQAIKNPSTRQTQIVKTLKSQNRIALTGTPVENKLADLWSLFDFTNPRLLGTSTEFTHFTQSLQEGKNANYAPLRKLISPYILRRLKTDKSIISDLPEKTIVNAYSNLTKTQIILYQKTINELKTDLKESTEPIQRRGLILSVLTRLKQICNHPSQAKGDNIYLPQDSGKFVRLDELCEEIATRQEKVLIFTQYREMTDPIAEHLSKTFGQQGLTLHGGTPIAERKKLVETFQCEDGPPFFVLSLKAGGTGLTLTEASHVIHFDRWWNPAVENQATDRAFRIGQKKNVLVHTFITPGTLEEKIDRVLTSKQALSNALIENQNEINLTELSDDELLNLITLTITS